MIDIFALVSGFIILSISGLISYTIRKLVPAALIIGALVIISSIAAVNSGLFEEFAPLFIIYLNGALMGTLLGYVFRRKAEPQRENGSANRDEQ